jgi:hypothetical protein
MADTFATIAYKGGYIYTSERPAKVRATLEGLRMDGFTSVSAAKAWITRRRKLLAQPTGWLEHIADKRGRPTRD